MLARRIRGTRVAAYQCLATTNIIDMRGSIDLFGMHQQGLGGKHQIRQWSFLAWVKEIREEWKENDKASQPMEDSPWEKAENVPFSALMKQSPKTHLKIFKETVSLFKLTILDREESVRLLKIEEETIRQLRRVRSGRAAAEADSTASSVDNITTTLASMETDALSVAKKVRKMFPKDMPTDAESALKAIKERRGDVKELAVDRLEVMGASISEFMVGYREGKEEGIAHVNSPEGSKYFASLDGLDALDANKSTSTQSKRIETETEKVAETETEKHIGTTTTSSAFSANFVVASSEEINSSGTSTEESVSNSTKSEKFKEQSKL